MFHNSTQRTYWLFDSVDEIEILRTKVNVEYRERFKDTFANILSAQEEKQLVEYYELVLSDVSTKFQPPIPSSATATAVAYMKRFYLKTSVMDHPPKEMYLVFLYMGCKVDEYNISAEKFVCILPGDRREKTMDFILSHELLLMQQLDFHLTIHNPYRPMEGFIIDMKTRLSVNPDKWRAKAEEFLRLALRTDACFLYSPSQIGLAALNYGCGNADVQRYVNEILGASEKNKHLLEQIRSIITMVISKRVTVTKDLVKGLEQRLKACRNPENNPDAKLSKRKKTDKHANDVDMEMS